MKEMENDKTDTTENDYWLSAYLYYHEPWETFITKAVSPFIDKMLEKHLVKRFFFIRYWEKGPHIRLRFQGNKQTIEEKIKPNLIKHFEDYYKELPSQYQSEKIKEIAKAENWYPNNSVQFIEYEPEVVRYGGQYAISVAEEHFQCSSKAVLTAISDSENWTYDHALGTAIQMY